jgi:general secretion pathway protein D
MQDRQEFIDRYFIFTEENDWNPPRDWSRSNGLVEDIRQSYSEIEEQARLEEESLGPEDTDREPSPPIELPSAVREGKGATLGTTRKTTTTTTKAPAKAAPKKAAPKRPARRGGRSELESPININPIARSVNVERIE